MCPEILPRCVATRAYTLNIGRVPWSYAWDVLSLLCEPVQPSLCTPSALRLRRRGISAICLLCAGPTDGPLARSCLLHVPVSRLSPGTRYFGREAEFPAAPPAFAENPESFLMTPESCGAACLLFRCQSQRCLVFQPASPCDLGIPPGFSIPEIWLSLHAGQAAHA